MKRPIRNTLQAAIMLLAAAAAQAETVNSDADLKRGSRTANYLWSRPMVEAMYRLGVEQDRKFGLAPNCSSQYRVEPYSIAILQPIDYPEGKPHPAKGAWNMRYQLQRCGESKFYNAVFIATGGGDAIPNARAHAPGTSNAGLLLMRDAMVSATAVAVLQSGQKDCKDIDVFDMRVTQPQRDVTSAAGKTQRGVWDESWTFRLCGQSTDVAIKFIPDADGGGTSFMLSPAKASARDTKPGGTQNN